MVDDMIVDEELVVIPEKLGALFLVDRNYTRYEAVRVMKSKFKDYIGDHAIDDCGTIYMYQPFPGIALWERCAATHEQGKRYWHFELY